VTPTFILRLLAESALVAYLPGALLYRLPIARRERRAALGAEERVFWAVMVSAGWSLAVAFALAALHRYQFQRLLLTNGAVSIAMLLGARARLRYRAEAARPDWHVLVPIALVLVGLWRFFPSFEYVIGGKDPGVYVNEGIQIAQRGSLIIHDATVAALPPSARDLFIPRYMTQGDDGTFRPEADYYSLRFMGFFVQDPDTGTVIGQLPHLFPVSIAIGYGLNGLSGARETTGVWAILGVLGVYFAGTRLAGRAAAAAGALLLSLHVIEVWFARCPNSDVVMQALLFAGLLAFTRAHQDEDGFFAPIAGVLLALLLFLRIDALLVLVAVGGAMLLAWLVDSRARPRAGFLVPLAIGSAAALWYLTGPLRAYVHLPHVYLSNLPRAGVAAGAAATAIGVAALLWFRRRHAQGVRAAVPLLLIGAVLALTAYAWVFRHPVGHDAPALQRLAPADAYALRTFVNFYLLEPGLLAALLGFALIVRRRFWSDPALLLTFLAFSCFFFYKLRINPDHFWMTRRFLPVILPCALLFIGVAALWTMRGPRRGLHLLRPVIGVVFLVLLGQQYMRAAAPILPHVEYAGVTARLEALAGRFTDRDLVIVESRDAGSDLHVLATPLAYIYARQVLVLASAKPDKAQFRAFLDDALTRYARVFFMGGGGTDLLSRQIAATPIWDERFQLPEYDSPLDAYPSGVRRKDFDFSIYELSRAKAEGRPFVLDVGYRDDLSTLRFFAKEPSEGRTIRWTQALSRVEVPGLTGRERQLLLTMSNGGRPPAAPPARVEVLFDGVSIGVVLVAPGFATYTLALPPALVAAAAARDDPAEIALRSTVWSPRQFLGTQDDRQLGVMLDRVEIH
jgi:hypothetical protein